MDITCISDLHGCKPALHGGDLLIIAGDLTARDTAEEVENFFKWLHDQPYNKKIVIAGNHDNYLETFKKEFMQLHCKDSEITNIEYLCDSGTEFQGLKIWGSPWSLWFHGIHPACKAFTGNEANLRERFALIPQDTDILITHGPPKTILDGIDRMGCGSGSEIMEYVGSEALYDRLCAIRPQLHVFGHIHEQGGKKLVFKRPGFGTENNTTCVNASFMGPTYKTDNEPVRIIL